ncbi:membrane-associated phospholipid phosphatase [Bradyrhizobium sp. GM0.4]
MCSRCSGVCWWCWCWLRRDCTAQAAHCCSASARGCSSCFLSVAVPIFVAEILKYLIGRGRPFVGGKANPFNFIPFEGTGAYASLPSGHAVTAFALAFAVSALWPRLRVFMFTYAIVILLTRLVLLAHHPSDVVAGALVGMVGAMAVRYWFAARRLGFAIRADGTIVPLAGAVSGRLKRVAHGASAP